LLILSILDLPGIFWRRRTSLRAYIHIHPTPPPEDPNLLRAVKVHIYAIHSTAIHDCHILDGVRRSVKHRLISFEPIRATGLEIFQ
jgi:hypothetical protein